MNICLDKRIDYGVSCIYRISFGTKFYIGSTVDMKNRTSNHVCNIKRFRFLGITQEEIENCSEIRIEILKIVKNRKNLRLIERRMIQNSTEAGILNRVYRINERLKSEKNIMPTIFKTVKIGKIYMDFLRKLKKKTGIPIYILIENAIEYAYGKPTEK